MLPVEAVKGLLTSDSYPVYFLEPRSGGSETMGVWSSDMSATASEAGANPIDAEEQTWKSKQSQKIDSGSSRKHRQEQRQFVYFAKPP